MLNLYIVADNEIIWKNHPTYKNARINKDVGLDIPMTTSVIVPKHSKAFTVDLGFKCESSYGWMLIPRSSISKTPLRLANSIGIIDKSYRGKVMVKVDNISAEDFQLKEGQCYFQIVAFSGKLPTYSLVSSINETERGEGGFGSTTNIVN